MSRKSESSGPRRVAHFLLHPQLADSPPNAALADALGDLGYAIDLYAPLKPSSSAGELELLSFQVGLRWIIHNLPRLRWRRYALFSGTTEDPLAAVGMLSLVHRRPTVTFADEIYSGVYRGDAREWWKRLCRYGMRRSAFNVVNDPARVELQREYAGLDPRQKVLVYPGSFRVPPPPVDRERQRSLWRVPAGRIAVGLSGGFNLTSGADWLLDAVQEDVGLHAVVQPLGLDPFARFLLDVLARNANVYVEPHRLGWREAWSQAAALDVGIAVYLNPAPQFQRMGTSSNRLCMYLAMGVPVIASRQPSFEFLERYDCGVLVDGPTDLRPAIRRIASRQEEMRKNARRCWAEHIDTESRYRELRDELSRTLGRTTLPGLEARRTG